MSQCNSIDPNTVMCADAHLLSKVQIGRSLSDSQQSHLQKSAKEVKRRQSLLPNRLPTTSLPIKESLSEIKKLVSKHPVVIVAGETGSGKTTQLPIECLRIGLGIRGMIGHTQPRRLAARSVSRRIAEELQVPLGEQVGYAVRFENKTSRNTLIKILTDGLLLTEIQRDPTLSTYDTIIVDEAHERSLNVDLLIGYLKNLLRKRRDLKVIVTSATIDVSGFSDFFDEAPVVQIEGRTYPVEIRYRPIITDEEQVVKDCLNEIEREPTSKVRDVLMFLVGEREIYRWSRWFRKHYGDQYEILPLYSRLPPKEQQRIFQPSQTRRILLSTNVAETSLTVPNIRYVIDFGRARISRYSLASRIQKLPIERVSQASVNQRTGRCGRLAPGICFRLYDEDDFRKRDKYTVPEIRRTNLATVLLLMKVFDFGAIEGFPFLDRPSDRAFASARQLLNELGAIVDDHITKHGKQMALLPIDARLARMLVEAHQLKALREVLIIVSALAIQDPFLRPIDKQEQADKAHKRFRNDRSDFLTYINLWTWAEQQRKRLSSSEFMRLLDQYFVSKVRYQEWRSLHRQLSLSCQRIGMRLHSINANFKAIHRALLSGSLSFLGYRLDNDSYLGTKGTQFYLFPGSALAKKKPNWIVSAEIFETSSTFARCIAGIHPSWLEKYAERVATKRHHDPFWDSDRQEGMILLDISVYGLLIVKDRPVRLVEIDKKQAREFFLMHGLVKSKGKIDSKEIEENRALVATLQEYQVRQRRLDVVVKDDQLRNFYCQRLPESVMSTASFAKWYRKATTADKENLRMSTDDILRRKDIHLRDDAFPTSLTINSIEFSLRYVFGPGQPNDGVSLQTSNTQLTELSEDFLEWIVPGFIEEKCLELMRGLPKRYRRQLTPVSEHLNQLLPLLLGPKVYRVGKLTHALSSLIQSKFGVTIDSRLWNPVSLSDHLKMNVQICSSSNMVVDQDRNLGSLRARHVHRVSKKVDKQQLTKYEQIGLKQFPTKGLSESFDINYQGASYTLYSILEDRRTSVDVQIALEPKNQYEKNLKGLCRFVAIQERSSIRFLQREFNKDLQLLQFVAEVKITPDLFDAIVLTSIRDTFFFDCTLPTTRTEYTSVVTSKRNDLIPTTLELMNWISNLAEQRKQIVFEIEQLQSPTYNLSKNDLYSQIEWIFGAGFPYNVPSSRMQNFPRYLKTLSHRLSVIRGGLNRDQRGVQEIQSWEKRLSQLKSTDIDANEKEQLIQLVQEYRISLFNQGMKTKVPISVQRLERAFQKYEPSCPISLK